MRHVLVALLLGCAAGTASATTFTVDNTQVDLPDANPGDGVCAMAPTYASGCSLRAAIMEANAEPGRDAVIVPAGAHIVLSRGGRGEDLDDTGDLDISDDLTVSTPFIPGSLVFAPAPRATVDANSIDRVFDVSASEVDLQNLAIVGGAATSTGSMLGGGVHATGAGTLSLEHCELANNSANAGGGIYFLSTAGRSLYVADGYLHDNHVLDLGAVNVRGGAIASSDGDPVPPTAPSVTILNTTISHNTAVSPLRSAALDLDYVPLVMKSSTVAGNSEVGVSNYSADVWLYSDTITGNDTGYGYGSRVNANVTTTLRDTVIADNTNDCFFGSGDYLVDAAYSLASDGSCDLAGGTGNLPNTDPLLKPLAPRYRDIPVRAPITGSPVIDAGDPVSARTGGSCLTLDEDRKSRPIDGDKDGVARCDIGAVEYRELVFRNGFEADWP